MKGLLSILFVLSLFSSTSLALAADSAAGKKLYEANCSKCHDSSIHTRPDHKIKSLDALDRQLMGCSKGAHVELSDADRANVEEYLSEQFYKFK
jgi:cytochrome c553